MRPASSSSVRSIMSTITGPVGRAERERDVDLQRRCFGSFFFDNPYFTKIKPRAVDPHSFFADQDPVPDPDRFLNAGQDPDPDADPYPESTLQNL